MTSNYYETQITIGSKLKDKKVMKQILDGRYYDGDRLRIVLHNLFGEDSGNFHLKACLTFRYTFYWLT